MGKLPSTQSPTVLPACVYMHCHFHTYIASTYIGGKRPVLPGWLCVKASHGRMEDRALYLNTGFSLLKYCNPVCLDVPTLIVKGI